MFYHRNRNETRAGGTEVCSFLSLILNCLCTDVMYISLGENERLAWRLTATHIPTLGCQGLTWKSSKWYENTAVSRKDQMGKRNGQ